MNFACLDKKRIAILPLLKAFKKDFYLAGGTALAMQIGHRISVDFDFFSNNNINTNTLFAKIKEIFRGHHILKIQEEKNTLTILLDNGIKISFFSYKYELLRPLIDTEYMKLASIADIGCMKLSAILGRTSYKDFVDIYFILQKIKIKELLFLAESKFKDTDINLFLKSLIYFDQLNEEPLTMLPGYKISYSQVKNFLKGEVKKILPV